MLQCYSIGGHISALSSSLFSIQLPRKGIIKKISWAVASESDNSANMGGTLQLSKRPYIQAGAVYEQPTEILDNVAFGVTFGTAVGNNTLAINKDSDQNMPCNVSDAFYIHGQGTLGGNELVCDCLIWVQE